MSKIFSSSQIRLWDVVTMHQESISSIELMERAAAKCVEWLKSKYTDTDTGFAIFCGHGNNGGDGLAIARLLLESAYRVKVYLNRDATRSKDNQFMLIALEQLYRQCIFDMSETPIVNKECIIIDAIFGTGLNREVEGIEKKMITAVNKFSNTKISIDIPSGLHTDSSVLKGDSIHADFTLSFQQYKQSFIYPESGINCGEIQIIDIGLDNQFEANENSTNFIIDKKLIHSYYKKRLPFTHKGSYGHSLLIVGSTDKMGAAVIASKACLRSGTGLLTVMVPPEEKAMIPLSIPEAMTIDYSTHILSDNLTPFNSIGIGCGIGTSELANNLLSQLLLSHKNPIVIDADAINLISADINLLNLIPIESTLTPHPKEFDRLFGQSISSEERKEKQINASIKYKIFIVLKDRYTCISTPEGICYYNITGNAGMAKGGSGDALTGIITGLYAQYQDMKTACILGVYLHGLSGNLASVKYSKETMLATDLIESLGDAFKQIQN